MKKFYTILSLLFLMLSFQPKALALNFQEAFGQVDKKPVVVLIYAQWADNYQAVLQQYRSIKGQFGNKFNFVELDIASNDAKAFSERYHIYPKLPYIIMFRDGGKISRYIPRDCASSASCTSSKLRAFIQW